MNRVALLLIALLLPVQAAAQTPIARLSEVADFVVAMDFSPDGTRLAVGDVNSLRIYDAVEGGLLFQTDFDFGIFIEDVLIAPDGDRVALALGENGVAVVDSRLPANPVILRRDGAWRNLIRTRQGGAFVATENFAGTAVKLEWETLAAEDIRFDEVLPKPEFYTEHDFSEPFGGDGLGQIPLFGENVTFENYPPDPDAPQTLLETLFADWSEPLIWFLYSSFDRGAHRFGFETAEMKDVQLITLRQTERGARALFSAKTSSETSLLLYDPGSDEVTFRRDSAGVEPVYLTDAVISPDGTRVALHGVDHSVEIFATEDAPAITDPNGQSEVEEAQPNLALTQGHDGRLVQIALPPGGDVFGTRGEGDRVFLWDRETGRQLRAVGGGQSLSWFDLSPDGEMVLTIGTLDGIKLWRVADGALETVLPDRDRPVWGKILKGGQLLLCDIAGCAIGTKEAFLTGAARGIPHPEGIGQRLARVSGLSPDEDFALFLFDEGSLLRLDLREMRFEVVADIDGAAALAVGAASALVGTEAGELQLFDIHSGGRFWTTRLDPDKKTRIAPLTGDRFLVDSDGSLPWEDDQPGTAPLRRVFNARTRQFQETLSTPANFFRTPRPGPAAYDPSTQTLYAALQTDRLNNDIRIDIRDMARGAWIGTIGTEAMEPKRLTFSQDGNALIVNGARMAVHWDLLSGNVSDSRPSTILSSSHPAGDGVAYLVEAGEAWGMPMIRSAALGERALEWTPPAGRDTEFAFGPVFEQIASNGQELLAVDTCELVSAEDCKVIAAIFDLDAIGGGALGAERVVQLSPPDGQPNFSLSPDGRILVGATYDRLTAYGAETGALLWETDVDPDMVYSRPLAFSPDGQQILLERERNRLFEIRDAMSGAVLNRIETEATRTRTSIVSASNGVGQLLHFGTERLSILDDAGQARASTALQGGIYGLAHRHAQSDMIFVEEAGGRNLLWSPDAERSVTIEANVVPLGEGAAFSPDGRLLALIETSGLVSLWRTETGTRLARLAALRDGGWAVIGENGRYDASDPGDFPALGWVLPEAPTKVLPLELFYREFFEPALLPRLVRGESFTPLPGLREINRLQPELRFVSVSEDPEHPGSARVTLEIAETQADGMRSGFGALKLFRDGQLVGQREFLPADVAGKQQAVFTDILLPRDGRSVTFSAYGFNGDGIKSTTIRQDFAPVTEGRTPSEKPRAYIVSVGVDHYANPAWDLNYAGADAALAAQAVAARLRASDAFENVAEVQMISRADGPPRASRAQIEAVLRSLGGESGDMEPLAGLPGAEALARARPEDFVYLFFAGHGLAGRDGRFHLFPSDFGEGSSGRKIGPTELEQTLPSDVLSALLLRIQSGNMVMVIDACNSAASVEGGGFKPGPMGSRGLGQLAYDKGMRILTASQAEGVALESDLLRHGALSYAMFREGLEGQAADRAPVDRQISFSELLSFAKTRVPSLYEEIVTDRFEPLQRGSMSLDFLAGGTPEPQTDAVRFLQRPALFDFSARGNASDVYMPVVVTHP
ncbi:outer membrane protein assembly factor BamB family protein [Aliiruegeria sabulilitoris]|uniref:outer membrane protein assembly factor BamB family protein n=1 Tax=Aliiruegeria sabulilitoris TaxID=1510458 RepID=UPI000835940D|nr:PQQ-binding-like beta-propeller repeat protein [Aliiruegeria sabulilitoris]NDR56817.1 PQQ-binding-like beta-propeller repeat protein [Pseudoruegeria sp. M32A2M]